MDPKNPSTGSKRDSSSNSGEESRLFEALLKAKPLGSSEGRPLGSLVTEALSYPLPSDSESIPLSTRSVPLGTTKAQQWKSYVNQQQTATTVAVDLELPSGMSIKAIRPNIFVMMQQGRIPDSLTPLVDRMISDTIEDGGAAGRRFAEAVKEDFEREPLSAYDRYRGLLELVWLEAVIDPIFVKNPNNLPPEIKSKMEGMSEEGIKEFLDSLIPISFVGETDLMFFFNWAQGVNESIISFRNRQASALADLPNVKRFRKVAM